MKIFEIEKTNVHDLLNSRRRGELDRPSGWAGRPARETSLAPAGRPAPTAIDHRAVNIRTGPKPLKLHVLDLGKLRLDKNFMVANSTVATAKNPNPRGQIIDIPVSAYYIEHPDGNILFDTGCHPDWGGPNARWTEANQEAFNPVGGEECMLPARLDMMGVGPDQIKHVVLSHLHCDHAGCVEYFRKSNIIVHEDEFAGAFRQYARQDHGSPYALKDLEQMIRAELHWREIARDEPDQNIVEGVRLLNFGPGHARGMLGLQVTLRAQAGVILVSDACYTAENYGPTARQPGISYDSLGIMRTVRKIQAIAGDTGSAVWFGHDAAQFETIRKATAGEGFYE
jgi:glyoxylase-like metal-dependent hydrolase (beta-lactamase superfamily II)